MTLRRLFVAFAAAALTATGVACGAFSGTEGGSTEASTQSSGGGDGGGAIDGSSRADASIDDASLAPETSADGTANNAGEAFFVSTVYPSVQPTCSAGCHNTGPNATGPIYFGADATTTYPIFKNLRFDEPNNIFLTKGMHSGPALTTPQTTIINQWIAIEHPDGG
jgi:hypothetical protein